MGLRKRILKALRLLRRKTFIVGMLKGVAASIEHHKVLSNFEFKSVVDIGANRGQFALLCAELFPSAHIYSFEPLVKPAQRFKNALGSFSQVSLYKKGIAESSGVVEMHVSKADDSSSMLPITKLQSDLFPGTHEVSGERVDVSPLDAVLAREQIAQPALLKLDVQGYELQALSGCSSMLDLFEIIYLESSFVELYQGQALASDVIDCLREKGYVLSGIYNTDYDSRGLAIQADFLFKRA